MKAPDKKTLIFFTLLFIMLIFVFYPTLGNPPRSDWWESLYFFHSIYSSTEPLQWLHILNSDCWGHVTFRPLSHMVLYIQHLIFGSNFFYMHIINFLLYFTSIILFYNFTLMICSNKTASLITSGVYSLLFSHFDIASWTGHPFLIIAFCLFLAGFIIYGGKRDTASAGAPLITAALFLTGMLCYEAFLLWPLALFFFPLNGGKNKGTWKPVITVYSLYLVVFLLTRAIGTYDDSLAMTKSLLTHVLSPASILRSIYAASFNILYNGLAVNIFPGLAAPAVINPESSNIWLGGYLYRNPPSVFYWITSFTAIAVTAAVTAGHLLRKKRTDMLKKLGLISFLLFSFTFLLTHFKYFSNQEYIYNFFQFRFQYVPNAFILLLILIACLGFLSKHMRLRFAVYIIVAITCCMNVCQTVSCISMEKAQLAPLRDLLSGIKTGIDTGQINKDRRIYLADDITEVLPLMCWNRTMGRKFIKGTYQWFFSKDEIGVFADSEEDSAWVVDRQTLSIKERSTR